VSADPEAEREGMLFTYDYLILDEAHDFPSAAINGLEFELSGTRLTALNGIANRLENLIVPLAQSLGEEHEWRNKGEELRKDIVVAQKELVSLGMQMDQGGIMVVTPSELDDHPCKATLDSCRVNCRKSAHRVRTILDRRCAESRTLSPGKQSP
jgi:hypothetical protein